MIHFEWDENKNTKNIKKHGIDFDEAKQSSMMIMRLYLMILIIQ